MKRDKIEFLIGWLDALRRDDRAALRAAIDPDAVWQGLREEWVCRNADEVIEMFAARRDHYGEIEGIELLAGESHAILHAHGGDVVAVEDVPLPDGIYNVFEIRAGLVARIDDYAERRAALDAAGLKSD